jgi:leader peptidase (prepilin peptidase)/N-methyltransferase
VDGVSWVIAATTFGLVVGSFANVCIHRIPLAMEKVWRLQARGARFGRMRSWLIIASLLDRPRRSHCPHCKAVILARDNIPLLGFLLLRGRCRRCGVPISRRYPAVEAANGVGWGLVALLTAPSALAAVPMLLLTVFLVLSVIDFEHQLLPDVLTLPFTGVGLVASLVSVPLLPLPAVTWPGLALSLPLGRFVGAALGAAGGYLLLRGVSWTYKALRHEEGLGDGDWRMMAMIGAFFGWEKMLLALFLATLGGTLVGIVLMVQGGFTPKSKLPLGTFLGASGILVLFTGDAVLEWYKSLFHG